MKRPSATVLPRSKHTSPRCMWSHWRPGCNGSRATGGAREGQLNFWCLGLSGSATYSFQDIPFISCSCLIVLHIIYYNIISYDIPKSVGWIGSCAAMWCLLDLFQPKQVASAFLGSISISLSGNNYPLDPKKYKKQSQNTSQLKNNLPSGHLT